MIAIPKGFKLIQAPIWGSCNGCAIGYAEGRCAQIPCEPTKDNGMIYSVLVPTDPVLATPLKVTTTRFDDWWNSQDAHEEFNYATAKWIWEQAFNWKA